MSYLTKDLVDSIDVGQRLDRYLVSNLGDISRSAVQQLIADKAVLVNGKPSKPGYILRLHDQIQVLRLHCTPSTEGIKPLAFSLDIIYEDNDLVIVNKAVGMVVHPAPGHLDDTLVNALLMRYPELAVGNGDLRPGIVHRLDRDTSGLLIVARNTHTQTAMIELMKRHEVEKRYLALVEGVVALDKGSIDAPIGRNPRYRQQMTITATDSREARTHFCVLKRYQRHTLLLLQLETGRTHQIRVHLKAIGHPVVSDPMYGSGHKQPGIVLQRQFLHAYQLRFVHPISGKVLECEAPIPSDLQDVLDQEDLL